MRSHSIRPGAAALILAVALTLSRLSGSVADDPDRLQPTGYSDTAWMGFERAARGLWNWRTKPGIRRPGFPGHEWTGLSPGKDPEGPWVCGRGFEYLAAFRRLSQHA